MLGKILKHQRCVKERTESSLSKVIVIQIIYIFLWRNFIYKTLVRRLDTLNSLAMFYGQFVLVIFLVIPNL